MAELPQFMQGTSLHIGDSVEVIDGSILGAKHYIVLNGDDESVLQDLMTQSTLLA